MRHMTWYITAELQIIPNWGKVLLSQDKLVLPHIALILNTSDAIKKKKKRKGKENSNKRPFMYHEEKNQ